MNPIRAYLNKMFASKRIVGEDVQLKGLLKADVLLRQLQRANSFPGLAITILKEGKIIFKKGYGFADVISKTPVDPQQTIFRIASVSKPIAATALACMVQEGILDLDASFYAYAPDYPKKRWDFTIRQLASHTAGIRGYQGKEYGLNKPYTIQESLKLFQDDPLLFEPGKGYVYTSFGWVLISLAMQKVSGIPFEEYVQKKVLNPLGMMSTFCPTRYVDTRLAFDEQEQLQRPTDVHECSSSTEQTYLATFYSRCTTGFRKAIPVDNFYKLAGGGYLSTSSDIAKFGQAYLDKKLLQDDVRNQFLKAQQVNEKTTYYGLGWQVSEDSSGRKFYGHIGNGVGGYSNLFIYPEERLVVSILINCTDPKLQSELDEVVNCFI